MGGLGIHWNFSLHPNPNPPDKVTTRDAHCGHHNEHLKSVATNTALSVDTVATNEHLQNVKPL